MRVTLLGQYPRDPERLLGGPEAAMAYVLPLLARQPDLDLSVIACLEGLSAPVRLEQDGVPISFLPRRGLGRVTWHWREVRAMLEELERYGPDLVHAHGAGLYAGAALASRRPAVVTVHGVFGAEARLLRGWRARLRGQLDASYERWVIGRTRHMIAISPYVERAFAHVFHGKSYLVENPVDERFFALEPRPVPGRLLLPAVVIPRKGVLPLLHALALVRQSHSEVHLHIAGSIASRPDYAAQCQDYVARAGLGQAVSFLGHLGQDELLAEYAASQLVVLAAFQETAPIALAQGMAAGLPVLATRVGGVADMVTDGQTGRTLAAPGAPDGDPEALAAALIGLLDDPQGAALLGQRARQQAFERFRASSVAEHTAQVYREVLAS